MASVAPVPAIVSCLRSGRRLLRALKKLRGGMLARGMHHFRRERERRICKMPEKRTLARARKDRRQGKSASTQAGEFVREEMHHIRSGKHGARSTKQAIAIGLSKARR